MKFLLAGAALLAVAFTGVSAVAQTDPMTPDMVATYDPVRPQADYIRREVMIPMRDGVKLFTVIVMRKGTTRRADPAQPHALRRRARRPWRNRSQKIEEILPVMDAEFVDDGYIRVYQDVRGIDRSEGDYVMTRPLRGPLNHNQGRPFDRRLGHDRLAGEERAREQRQGRHHRLLL